MQFVMQWIQQQRIEFATLSVDCRNTPALRLYQRFGFQITEAYHAWACTPAWFAESSPPES
jgi:ribosomal protein S18 acetylase RimI-like enzyme